MDESGVPFCQYQRWRLHAENESSKLRIGKAEIAIGLISLVLAFTLLPSSGQANTVYRQTNSHLCEFWVEGSAHPTWVAGGSHRVNSCATYAATGYDYYQFATWYGTYYDWCYTGWQSPCRIQNNSGYPTQVYGYAQIYEAGEWQQWELQYATY